MYSTEQLDVEMTISVVLSGSISTSTSTLMYIPHLKKSVKIAVPNSIEDGQILRIKDLGNSTTDGRKGCLLLKFDCIDRSSVVTQLPETDNSSTRKTVYSGEIIKCPHCGNVLSSFESNCSMCGYELRNSQATTSMKEFSRKIELAETAQKKIDIIKTYAIPNTKEDIKEFLYLALANIDPDAHWSQRKDNVDQRVVDAWIAKFDNVYKKAMLIIKDDDLSDLYDQYTLKKQKIISRKRRRNFSAFLSRHKDILIALFVVFISLSLILILALPTRTQRIKLDNLIADVEQCIDNGDFVTARIKAEQIIDDSGYSEARTEKYEEIRESLLKLIDEKQMEAEGKIYIGSSHKDLIGDDYHDVISRLKAQGFTNVKTVAIEDLVTGWLSFDGEVEKVTIDGISEFRADAVFLRSAEVVIYYHTFK